MPIINKKKNEPVKPVVKEPEVIPVFTGEKVEEVKETKKDAWDYR